MESREGTIKFNQIFRKQSPLDYNVISELDSWRKILYDHGLIGQDRLRYGGAGYGNVSQRLPSYDFLKNKNRFVITGTQTGGLSELNESHYTTVLEYYPEKNLVVAEGPIEASSESMTHGIIYDLDDSIRFIFHTHSPKIWRCAEIFKMPTTREDVEYGTPEMAEEVERLFKNTDVRYKNILSMGGHEDGIISFGRTSFEAGTTMLDYLEKVSS